MMLVRTHLLSSPIEGIGIFASEPILKGESIWHLDPGFDALFTADDVAGWPTHMDDFIKRYCYRHRDMQDMWVLELDNGRFMNHSAVPNTDFREFYRGYAIRDIQIGEELTCNYFEFDVDFDGAFVNGELTSSIGLASSLER